MCHSCFTKVILAEGMCRYLKVLNLLCWRPGKKYIHFRVGNIWDFACDDTFKPGLNRNDLQKSKRNSHSRAGQPCYQYAGYNRGGKSARATEDVVFFIAREAKRSTSFSYIWESNRMDKMLENGRTQLF